MSPTRSMEDRVDVCETMWIHGDIESSVEGLRQAEVIKGLILKEFPAVPSDVTFVQ